jgi:hypothetical protein
MEGEINTDNEWWGGRAARAVWGFIWLGGLSSFLCTFSTSLDKSYLHERKKGFESNLNERELVIL